MEHKRLFAEHLEKRQEQVWGLLEDLQYDSILIDSGCESYYTEDDQSIPYRPAPAFKSWCPEVAPGSVIYVKKGEAAQLLRVVARDFWHAVPTQGAWVDQFSSSREFANRDSLLKNISSNGRNLWIGPGLEMKEKEEWDWNPQAAVSSLYWDRGLKTQYEIECLRTANKIAALGHKSAYETFLEGGSERQIHSAYLSAADGVEWDLPYNNIVCLDQNAAVLHYQYKSNEKKKAGVLLLDGGFLVQGYGSDITRTWTNDRAPEVFRSILGALEVLQKNLAEQSVVGANFADLHLKSLDGIGEILLKHDVIKNISATGSELRETVRAFYPHGLGHMLGALVHDVSGRQKNRQGDPCDVHAEDPKLRTNRALRASEVVTVEPGIYWIPMLWEKLPPDRLNIPLMKELSKWGGMRIEDNIVVGEKAENLTRKFLP